LFGDVSSRSESRKQKEGRTEKKKKKKMHFVRRALASPGGGASVGLLVLGAAGVATLSASLYNVDGGHAAIVFNRFVGIKVPKPPLCLVAFHRCSL
jgi:hypothetical protein